ncbi:DNA mismatch repair endonuclease MutL [Candidatus Peregrinibacteria bacterium]|nr:DNA mismatch repair endonuclease MutL [Candidatus Peregrinibacteria bacterium]
MSIIKILSESLVNQIAAGEVIERPASVLKELLENSIDAGADRIIVEIKDSGKSFIKVFDNGFGMTSEDLSLALQRHATSKISDESDLWKIHTFGFRGEALASISSVSKMVLRSRTNENISGAEIKTDGGEMSIPTETGMSTGTQIEIYDLFFNTPARQKYLKKDSTELAHITSVFNTIALGNHNIAFKFIHNNKIISDLPKVTDLISRISDIFGRATSDAMIPVFFKSGAFEIDGFVGKPLLSRSTSQYQYFFVNNRAIQHFLLANTIKSAFHSMLMDDKKPVFAINIKIDPSLIDVNVHPRKLEIRFEDQQSIVKAMYNAVKGSLEKHNLTPKAFTETFRYKNDGVISYREKSPSSADIFNALNFSKEIFSSGKNSLFERSFKKIGEDADNSCQEKSSINSITQIANSYIVAENEDGLVLIDQHAAHERVRYEELMDQFDKKEKQIQSLLIPSQIELSAEEVAIIEDNKNIFIDLGFEIENFGGNTFVVYAVPNFLSKEDIVEVVKGILDDILQEKNPSKMHGKIEQIITYMACRSAIKFGKKLTPDEMQALIMQMEKLKRPYTCPHGRPTMISLTLNELEKMFGRK